jgi:DNA uptake protein ComE-like DNA-binding protein
MWKAIIIWLRNFFGFSRTEANGFVLILLIMLLVLFAPLINKHILLERHPNLFLESDYKELDSLLALMDKQLIEADPFFQPKFDEDRKKSDLHNFDPNTVSSTSLQNLGLPRFLADRIIKYRSLVKPFEKAEDLLTIYGMDTSLFLKLKPYIKIEKVNISSLASDQKSSAFKNDSATNNLSSYQKLPSKYKLKAVDINTADTAELRKIYGIGVVYAQRIVDYRDLLGGFSDKSQYKEVYGLEAPALDSLKRYTNIDETVQLMQLKLNTCSEEELSKHPYISYKQAKLIVSYRNAHGAYGRVENLMKIKILDTAFVTKIKPYLSIEP